MSMMFRFLFLFAVIFITAESFEYCKQRSSTVGPILTEIIYSAPEKCAPGFRKAIGSGSCFRFAPSNSISFDLFSKQCKCDHGHPNPHKDNRNRFKRHFRGGFPQFGGIRLAQFQPRPIFAPQQPRRAVGYAPQYQAVQQQHHQAPPRQQAQSQEGTQTVDMNTFECHRWADHCDQFPRQVDRENCPPGWTYYPGNQFCYKFYPPQSWHEAEKTCNAENAHLSTVKLQTEMFFTSDMLRQIYPNIKHQLQSNPLIIEEYHSWIGLNLTDRSKMTWTEGEASTYFDWRSHSKFDNAGGNENCGFVVYRHDCTIDNFIQIGLQDARCDTQMPFACKLRKAPPPTPAPTLLFESANDAAVQKADNEKPQTSSTTETTTKKVKMTCMV